MLWLKQQLIGVMKEAEHDLTHMVFYNQYGYSLIRPTRGIGRKYPADFLLGGYWLKGTRQ
jgi:hypothetical protein